MTTREQIETLLAQAVRVEPSTSGLLWLDQRVAAVAARPVELRRAGPQGLRFFLRPLALAFALLLLAGVVAASLGLLDRIIETSGTPGWRVAWDRAQRLDLRTTDAGVTITIERAYADINQVMVGFTVAGLEAPPAGEGPKVPLEWVADLRDPTGQPLEEWAGSGMGIGEEETHLSAVIMAWEGTVRPVAGTWHLTFTSVGYHGGGWVSGECYAGNTDPGCASPRPERMVAGTWRFAFELPKPVGTVLSTDAAATVGQVTLHLSELRIAPSRVTARIGIVVDGGPVAYWNQPQPTLRHGGTSLVANADRYLVDPAKVGAPDLEFETSGGSDEVAGTWEIVIPELTYGRTNDEEIHVAGPWTLTVNVP
jgi:hypothetical protein